MSKESFEAEWAEDWYELWVWERYEELIEKHGGVIHWKLPTPEGAGCTCPQRWKDDGVADFDKPGYWHLEKCALYVPF